MMKGLPTEGFVLKDHPLREIKPLADSAPQGTEPLLDETYAAGGRPSIPPEHPLKSSLLMVLSTSRSEGLLCEEPRYNLPFKWFMELIVEDEPFHPTTFAKNYERLLEANTRAIWDTIQNEQGRRSVIDGRTTRYPV